MTPCAAAPGGVTAAQDPQPPYVMIGELCTFVPVEISEQPKLPIFPGNPTDPIESGNTLTVSGFTGDYVNLNGNYHCSNPDAASTDWMYRHETVAEVICRCEDETNYWSIHFTSEDENIRPISPAGGEAYCYVDDGELPWNDDGTSKAWTNMVSTETIEVVKN